MTDRTQYTFEEKVAALKKMHAHSHPDARAQIRAWEDDISRLKLEAEWLAHPSAGELRAALVGQMRRIESALANDETLADAERKPLFRMKDVIFALLAVLTRDPAAELQSIERSVNDELS